MAPFLDNSEFRNLLYSWPEMAMVLLYKNYYNSLIAIADMHTGDRHASEDVLQEVFTDLWKRHKELGENEERIQKYLIRAVQYHSISYYRSRTKAEEREKRYYYAHSEGETELPAEAVIISEEKQKFIRLIVGTFPAREKECLLLQIDHGMTLKEIARHLGVSRKAVERSLASAKTRLKRFSGIVS